MMSTAPHVTSGLGLRKFQADGFLLTRVYHSVNTVCPTLYRTRLAGGPLLRVATIRRTTDTHYRHIPFHFSHNERAPVQISLQYLNW